MMSMTAESEAFTVGDEHSKTDFQFVETEGRKYKVQG